MDFRIDQKKIISDMNFTWKLATRFWNKMLMRTIVNKSPRNGSQLRDKKWKERRKIDWSKNIVMVAPHSDNGCHWLACSYSFPKTQGRKLRIWISLFLSLSHTYLCVCESGTNISAFHTVAAAFGLRASGIKCVSFHDLALKFMGHDVTKFYCNYSWIFICSCLIGLV